MIAGQSVTSGARYLCVGATCALANWASMLLIDENRYLVSSILLFVPIGTMGFMLHARWTFRARPTLRGWIAYLFGLLPGFPLSVALLAVLRDVIHLPLWFALPTATIIMTVGNFFVSKWAIMPRKRSTTGRSPAAYASAP